MKRNDFKNRVASFFRIGGTGAYFVSLVAFLILFSISGTVMASGGEGGEGAGGLNPLNWKTDLAIWTAVVFFVLVFVLSFFAFRPIANALDAREQAMHDRVAAAEKANLDARALLDQYQKKLEGSEKEVREMLEAAKADAEKVANAIVEKAKDAASNEHKRALHEIESATEVALQELASKSADLATSLAGKILKEKIDPSQHSMLINGAIQQFTKN